jgi:hypothetical protein
VLEFEERRRRVDFFFFRELGAELGYRLSSVIYGCFYPWGQVSATSMDPVWDFYLSRSWLSCRPPRGVYLMRSYLFHSAWHDLLWLVGVLIGLVQEEVF